MYAIVQANKDVSTLPNFQLSFDIYKSANFNLQNNLISSIQPNCVDWLVNLLYNRHIVTKHSEIVKWHTF